MLDWSVILTKTTALSYPDAAGYKTGGASQEAADKINPKRGKLHDLVLKALAYFPKGATADQIADFLERHRDAIKPRLSELKAMGLVEKTSERGLTELGGSCHKWQLNACNLTQNGDN